MSIQPMEGDISRTRNALQQYHVRAGSNTSAASQQVEPSPVCMLEWDHAGCRRTFLGTADELRTVLDAGRPRVAALRQQPAHQRSSSAPPSRSSSSSPSVSAAPPPHRLFLVHGMPIDFVMAIRSSLDIDPAFLDAHAGRRRYRPLRWRKQARFAHYVYPELVRDFGGSDARAAMEEEGGGGGGAREARLSTDRTQSGADLMGGPIVRRVRMDSEAESGGGEPAVAFCRASLWMGAQADVLFLDRPVWRDPASALRKARRGTSVIKPYTMRSRGNDSGGSGGGSGLGGGVGSSSNGQKMAGPWEVVLADGDEISSLEDVLFEMLKDAAELGDRLVDVVAQIAYDQWLEFFQVLQPPGARHASHPAVAAFYWQVLQFLEQNVDATAYLRQDTKSSSAENKGSQALDWTVLQTRLQRRIELLPPVASLPHGLVTSSSPASSSAKATTPTGSKKPSRQATLNSAMWRSAPPAPGSSNRSPAETPGVENQRALDRISYLGGILIPLPIVSGILSMNNNFSPGAPLFWVFWAWSIPLSALATIVIYADIIRKAEVWVEVTAEHVVAARPETEAVPVRIDTVREEKKTVSWNRANAAEANGSGDGATRRRNKKRHGATPPALAPTSRMLQTQAVAYTIEHEEELIGMPLGDIGAAVSDASASSSSEYSSKPEPPRHPQPLPDSEPPSQQPVDAGMMPAIDLYSYPPEEPLMILEQPTDGSKPRKAWRRQQLGWYGAVRSIVGLRKPRKLEDVPVGVVAYEKPEEDEGDGDGDEGGGEGEGEGEGEGVGERRKTVTV